MPRYFGNETYNGDQGAVKWYNGACAVAEDDTAAIAFLDAIHGIKKDTNKHELTALDKLPRDVLDEISLYLGVALTQGDGKYDVVRDIENSISTKYLTTLTVTSVQTAVAKESTITVTTAKAGATHIHKYKAAVAAPVLLYGDEPDATWKTFTSGTVITPLTDGEHIAVVECNAAGDFVLGYGTIEIDAL